MAKIFEKILLIRLNELDFSFNLNFTGTNQHGFKKSHSTITAALDLQSKISDKLDQGEFVAVASFDLSAAFDVINREILLVRLKKYGFPEDLLSLITNWLSNRQYYIEIGNERSSLINNDFGTIQGSCLGPVLFNLFLRPIFDLIDLTTYADDNYLLETSKDVLATLGKVKMKSEFLIKWLKDSGLKVNAEKTEICIFHKNDVGIKSIVIDNKSIKTKKELKVLGIIFDQKLNWQKQVLNAISKAKKSLHALRLLSKYLDKKHLITISTAYFYQRLYYGAQIWLSNTLNSKFKHKLLQASSNCLRICCRDYRRLFSFQELHILCNRAFPLQWLDYIQSNLIYDLLSTGRPEGLHKKFSSKLIFHDRTNKMYTRPSNLTKVGTNCITNRSMNVMKKLSITDFKLNRNMFKSKMKNLFLNPSNYFL